MTPEEFDKLVERLHTEIQILPCTRKKLLYERLRRKIGDDLSALMVEQDLKIEDLAKKLRLTVKQAREWLWEKDLKLSELTRVLDVLDCELWPLFTSRINWRIM